MLRRSSLSILLAAVLSPSTIGCGVAASAPQAPMAAALMPAGMPLARFSVEFGNSDARLAETTADLNHAPIHVWIAAPAPDRAEAVYVVGQTDGVCSRRVSRLLEDIAGDLSFQDAWITYGTAIIKGSDRLQQRRLGELSEKLTSVASQTACRGQVHLHRLPSDEIDAASNRMRTLAADLFQSAARAGRPVLLWHNAADGLPRFVPVTVGAHAVPLTITFSLEELKIPDAVLRGLTLNGATRYIAQLEAELANIDLLLDLLRPGRQHPAEIVSSRFRFDGSAIHKVRAEIDAARASIDRALKYEEQAVEAARLLGIDAFSFVHSADFLRQAYAENQRALAQLDGILPGPAIHEIQFRDVKITARQSPIAADALARLRGQHETLSTEIAEVKRVQAKPLSNPVPVLVDAFLRGWPATFSSAESNVAYDRWVNAEQGRVWALAKAKLWKAGASFAEPSRSLLLSNVMFHVRRSEDRVLVTPMYVMSGPGFQVADINASVVRYESASAEQNLSEP